MLTLVKVVFTEEMWGDVQHFDCGELPHQKEVSNWLKDKEGALAAIKQKKGKRAEVWLYKLPGDILVGFGALARGKWRWKGQEDPQIPVTKVIWYAVAKEYQKKPEGDRDGHYSFQIFDDLLEESTRTKDAYPIIGLFVSTENQRAINLYREFGFTDDGFLAEEGYQKMYAILDEIVLERMLDEEWKKRQG